MSATISRDRPDTSSPERSRSMAIRIRPLRRSDYDAMIALFRVCGLSPKTNGRDSLRSFAQQLRRNADSYLGAFDGGRLVGTVLGTHDTRKGWINRLAVDPGYRRRAIAARPVLGDHRKHDGQGEDAFVEKPLAESFRGRRIAEHDGGNGRLAPSDVETHRDEPLLEVFRVRPELLHVTRLRFQDIDRRGARGRHRRRVRTAQEPRPRLVERIVSQFVRSGDVSTDDAEGLRERAEFDLDFLLDVEVGRDAATTVAEHALAVGVVDIDHRAKFVADPGDVAHGCDVAVHREHPIRDDEDFFRPAVDLFERPFEIRDVAVSVDDSLGLR